MIRSLGIVVVALSSLVMTACPPPVAEGEGEAGEGEGEGEGEPSGLAVEVDADTYPCDVPAAWPIALRSTLHPLTVHIRDASEADIGQALLDDLDDAWDKERALGFPEVPGDAGGCGDDDTFDAFLFRNSDLAYVDFVDVIPGTPFADVSPYMVMDWEAWPDPIPAHELNHAMQASCDWGETAFIYEATSQYIEEQLFPDDNTYREVMVDYQSEAHLALDHDDEYVGFYMYGAALYLFYLKEAVFVDDPTWIGRMWLGARSTELPDGTSDEPDIEDVLDDMIQEARGISFVDSVVEFSRWRYYMGSKDDGAHFSEAGENDESARVVEVPIAVGASDELVVSELGTLYLALSGAGSVTVDVTAALDGGRFVAQALPGTAGTDGDPIAGTTSFTVPLEGGQRVLALTLVPPVERLDPDVAQRPSRTVTATVR